MDLNVRILLLIIELIVQFFTRLRWLITIIIEWIISAKTFSIPLKLAITSVFLWVLFAFVTAYIAPQITPIFMTSKVAFWQTAENRSFPVQIIDQAGRYLH